MIDYKSEAADIATVYADGGSVMPCEVAIIDLCTRYGNEKLEEAAKVCEAKQVEYEAKEAEALRMRDGDGDGAAYYDGKGTAASELAEIIRATKQEEG